VKSSGKLGVALVTSGPGATNAITGIADANADSVPMLVFTGQVATPGIGKDAFQEADIIGVTMPITKYNYQIRETQDIPRVITEAVHIATTDVRVLLLLIYLKTSQLKKLILLMM
jgi:acetolactate synthase-1/2/3 large subunit